MKKRLVFNFDFNDENDIQTVKILFDTGMKVSHLMGPGAPDMIIAMLNGGDFDEACLDIVHDGFNRALNTMNAIIDTHGRDWDESLKMEYGLKISKVRDCLTVLGRIRQEATGYNRTTKDAKHG